MMRNNDKLCDISEINMGINLSRYRTNEKNNNLNKYHVLTLKSINDGYIDENKFDVIETEKEIDEKYLLRKGDVLLSLDSPYLSIYIYKTIDKAIISNAFAIIRTNKVNSEYLSYYFNSDKFLSELNRIKEGSTNNKLTLKNLRELNITLLEDNHEKQYIGIIRLLNERIRLKTEELNELKKIRRYYINRGDSNGNE